MAINAEQNIEQPKPREAAKPALDPADYWRPTDRNITIKTGVATPDSLTMTSPYGKGDDLFKSPNSKIDDVLKSPPNMIDDLYKPSNSKLDETLTVKPYELKPIVENEPREGIRDLYHPPKEASDVKEPLNPRQEADKRDADALMDAARKGNLDDLKNLVSDMSPAKLKRVAEQMKAEGFDISTTKDGKFVMFNKELGLGVSIQPGKDGEPGKAEVVKQDKDGNYVASTDGLDPEKLLKNLSKQLPADSKDIAKILHDLDNDRPKRNPWDLRTRWDLKEEQWSHDMMLKGATNLEV